MLVAGAVVALAVGYAAYSKYLDVAGVHLHSSVFLSNLGRHAEAITEITRARELDPLSPGVNTNLGFRLFFARRYDEAIDTLKQILEPYWLTHAVLGYTYAAKGMHREAIAAYQEAIKLSDDGPSTQVYLGASYAHAGERERAQGILERLQTSQLYVSLGELAILYAALGQREQAFTSLEKAFAAHDVQLQFIGVDPLETLREMSHTTRITMKIIVVTSDNLRHWRRVAMYGTCGTLYHEHGFGSEQTARGRGVREAVPGGVVQQRAGSESLRVGGTRRRDI